MNFITSLEVTFFIYLKVTFGLRGLSSLTLSKPKSAMILVLLRPPVPTPEYSSCLWEIPRQVGVRTVPGGEAAPAVRARPVFQQSEPVPQTSTTWNLFRECCEVQGQRLFAALTAAETPALAVGSVLQSWRWGTVLSRLLPWSSWPLLFYPDGFLGHGSTASPLMPWTI